MGSWMRVWMMPVVCSLIAGACSFESGGEGDSGTDESGTGTASGDAGDGATGGDGGGDDGDGSGGSGGGGSGGDDGTGDGDGTTGDGATGGDDGSTGGATTDPGGGGSYAYVAVIAECVGPGLDPDACEAITDPDAIQTDAQDIATGGPIYSFLRFDLDDAFAGAQVTSVTLRMHTADYDSAESEQSGEIFEVEPFERDDLYVGAPAQVGNTPIGPDVGPVAGDQDVTWALPETIAVAGGSIYLGLFPASEDGVHYWDETTADPPTVIVVAQ